MDELIIPKIPKSDTGNPLPEGYVKYAIPSSLTTEGKLEVFLESINNVVNKEIELEKRFDDFNKKTEEYKKEIDKQSNRAVEIIGIFSAILALLIIDVSIIKSAESFLSAILLIVSLTCSMSIFAVLIHSFFSPNAENKFKTLHFWIPILILIILTTLGIISFVCKWSWSVSKP
jgi:hypothetical protein